MNQKKILAEDITGSTMLGVSEGDAFKTLIFKDQSGLLYALTLDDGTINQRTLEDQSYNSKFSENPIITITEAYIIAYGNNEMNVFYPYITNQIRYLGNFLNINFIEKAASFYQNDALP